MVWLPGGGGGCAAVADAALAVESGQADVVVAFRSLCQGQFHQLRSGTGRARRSRARAGGPQSRIAARRRARLHAAVRRDDCRSTTRSAMRRHMYRYGTTSEQMGQLAVTFRAHASRNPRAVMRDRAMTLAEHQASPMVADPFRLFDCCLESDGACAVLVTTAERARDGRRPPVEIRASAQGTVRGYGWGPFSNDEHPGRARCDGRGDRRRPPALGARGRRPGRRRRRRALRPFLGARPPGAQKISGSVPAARPARSSRAARSPGRTADCRRTPTAGASPRPTSTGSITSSKASGSFAAIPPARWTEPRSRW